MAWQIDTAHSQVEFSVRHMMISNVRGRFETLEGTVDFDQENPARSSVDVRIAAASINTRDARRDGHLKSADFFDVEKYPAASFKSTKIEALGGDRYRVTGNLAVHGVSRPVVLEATYEGTGKDPWGGERAGFSATTTIDRREFGLQWNKALETGGVLVGEKVEIEIEVEAVRRRG